MEVPSVHVQVQCHSLSVLDSAHVGVPPVCEGDVGLLHHLRRRPPQHVVRPAGFVVGSWEDSGHTVSNRPGPERRHRGGRDLPEALAPPNGC